MPECQDGPTWIRDKGGLKSHESRRVDAWAMPRSWSNTVVSAYEVKTSTRDFRRDYKWRDYLPLCNAFWFVTPPGVVDPEELPAEAGLLVLSGSRLMAKKQAPLRQVDVPAALFRYILVSRARIDGEEEQGPEARARRLANFAEHLKAGKDVAALACRALRDERARLAELRQEMARLQERLNDATTAPFGLQHLEAACRRMRAELATIERIAAAAREQSGIDKKA